MHCVESWNHLNFMAEIKIASLASQIQLAVL